MNSLGFLLWLTRGAIIVTLGGLLVPAVCNRWQIDSSSTRFAAALLVFLTALSPWSWTIEVPWYEPVAEANQQSIPNDNHAPPSQPQSYSTGLRVEQGLNANQASPWVGDLTNSPDPVSLLEAPAGPVQSPWPDFATVLPTSGKLLIPLWILSVAGAVLLGTMRYLRVVWNCRSARDDEQELVDEWNETQTTIAPRRRPIPLQVSTGVGPMLGFLPQGYSLVIPQPVWGRLDSTERRLIMRHELAHYLRGDVLASFFLRIVSLPFAYHPCAWRLVGMYDESAEWACDRAAAQGGEAVEYARALNRLIESQLPETSLALGRCAQSHPLVLRVRRVLKVPESKETRMKTTLFGATLALVAFVSLAQVRLIAQEREATIERVKQEIAGLREKLVATKAKADEVKESGKQLHARVTERVETLKTLAKDPSTWSETARRKFESLKGTDESAQLASLDGVDKLGDEGVVLCAYAILTVDREPVRRKALSALCALGEPGLPALAKGFESLAAEDRLFAAKELAKHKDKYEVALFARMARDESPEIRAVALEAGFSKGEPLVFLSLAAEGKQDQAK
ncbi:MAG: M56 family metallopeptidase [Pirellulales bacterium]